MGLGRQAREDAFDMDASPLYEAVLPKRDLQAFDPSAWYKRFSEGDTLVDWSGNLKWYATPYDRHHYKLWVKGVERKGGRVVPMDETLRLIHDKALSMKGQVEVTISGVPFDFTSIGDERIRSLVRSLKTRNNG